LENERTGKVNRCYNKDIKEFVMKKLILFYILILLVFSYGRDCPVPDFAELPSWADESKIIGDILCVRQGTKVELEELPAIQLEGCDTLDEELTWSFASDKISDFGLSGEPNLISIAPALPQKGIVYIYATLMAEDSNTVGTIIYNVIRPAPMIIPHCGGT
jgi:hypothetical protein